MLRQVKRIFKWCAYISALTLLCGAGWYVFCDKPELFPEQTHSRAFYDRDGELLRLTLSHDEQYRLWTSLNDIPTELQQATLLYEDQYFYQHVGVNPVALFRAVKSSYLSSGRRMGASTISMQLARLRFELKTKTISGKLRQMRLALQLERHYSKQEILEAYFNLAPYGHNIQGAAAASVIYFQKPVQELSLAESMLLAVVPQNPNKRLPSRATGYQYATAARTRLIELWDAKYNLEQMAKEKLSLPLKVAHPKELPYYAPHTIDSLLVALPVDAEHVQHTSLDLDLQAQIEKLASNYITQKQSIGLYNTAVMVLDSRNMQVVSELGSVSYHDAAIHGQVNGARALRSPGSTLKPFIYALAMEQGLIHPQSILKDAPTRFGAYTPENSDEYFAGPLSASDALVRSRNIPAVRLLQQLDTPNFHSWLSQFELSQLFSEDHYGLALALGGNEISMLELVELYASLANLGDYQKASYQAQTDTKADTESVLSPEVAFLTLKMLSRNLAVDVNSELKQLQQANGRKFKKNIIPWKTGTSYAFRDAWSVGLVGHYVVAVWVGNFDGSGNPALTGRKAAAPLFFQIARSLQAREPLMQASWTTKEHELNVRRLPMCKSSGDLALQHCPDPVNGWFIPSVSPIREQGTYREVLIDKASGLRACDKDPKTTEKHIFSFWDSDIEDLFQQAGIKTNQVPAYHPSCEQFSLNTNKHALAITSPMPSLDYVIQLDRSATQTIPLMAVSESDAKKLYWFVANEFVGMSEPQKPLLWQAKQGAFDVTVIDDLGRSDKVQLRTSLAN